MNPTSLIVFDMDGVLVDVSGSYRDTVRQTARLFFTGAQAFASLPDPLFSLADLASVKQSGGLNNDWDLTFVILNLLFSRVPCGERPPAGADPWRTHAAFIGQCDVSGLARFLRSTDRPLAALIEENGRVQHGFVADMYAGDVGSGNVIKQIFQEIYLGADLFASVYGMPPKIHGSGGYIDREKLLVEPALLGRLSRSHVLAVATGRPRVEADYPLDHFGIRRYFTRIYALDDCMAEEKRIRRATGKTVSLSKPDPYMLDAIGREIEKPVSCRYYLGDMPDDMVAAGRARPAFVGIGILASSPDRETLAADLHRAGADHIIDDFAQLERLVNSARR